MPMFFLVLLLFASEEPSNIRKAFFHVRVTEGLQYVYSLFILLFGGVLKQIVGCSKTGKLDLRVLGNSDAGCACFEFLGSGSGCSPLFVLAVLHREIVGFRV